MYIVKEETRHKVCNNFPKYLGAPLTIEGCLIAQLYHKFCSKITIFLMCLIWEFFFDTIVAIFIVVIHFKEVQIASNKLVYCWGMLLARRTLPYLLLKILVGFSSLKLFTKGVLVMCLSTGFSPNIFTKGVSYIKYYIKNKGHPINTNHPLINI